MSNAHAHAHAQARAIGPVGTIARVAVGFAAISLAFVNGLEWWAIPLGLVGLPLLVTIGHAWLIRQYPAALRELSMAGAWATFWIFVPLLIIPYTNDAAWLWLGTSMWLAATRGYAGCEVLAFSNWVLRREDTVGCLLFTPIDHAEARWRSEEFQGSEPADHDGEPRPRDERSATSSSWNWCCGPRPASPSRNSQAEAGRQ